MDPVKILTPNSEKDEKIFLSEMLQILNTSNKMSLAYVNDDGQPVQSFMLYVVDDDELDIYFGTLKRFPKYNYLLTNPIVSILVEENKPDPKKVVTIKGIVGEEIEGKELEERLEWFTSKNKCKYHIKSEKDFVMFKAHPISIRLIDGSSDGIVRKDLLL